MMRRYASSFKALFVGLNCAWRRRLMRKYILNVASRAGYTTRDRRSKPDDENMAYAV
ncbi:MAG: hypothetical protein LBD58_13135 [Treponema sp.]|jgi:hypothetical protein|nr:hypothetical protein [Treponema sp.]